MPIWHQEHLPLSRGAIYHRWSPPEPLTWAGSPARGNSSAARSAALLGHRRSSWRLCCPSAHSGRSAAATLPETHTQRSSNPHGLGMNCRDPQVHASSTHAEKVKRSSFGSDQSSNDRLESTSLNVFVSLRKGSCRPSSRFKWLWRVLE